MMMMFVMIVMDVDVDLDRHVWFENKRQRPLSGIGSRLHRQKFKDQSIWTEYILCGGACHANQAWFCAHIIIIIAMVIIIVGQG